MAIACSSGSSGSIFCMEEDDIRLVLGWFTTVVILIVPLPPPLMMERRSILLFYSFWVFVFLIRAAPQQKNANNHSLSLSIVGMLETELYVDGMVIPMVVQWMFWPQKRKLCPLSSLWLLFCSHVELPYARTRYCRPDSMPDRYSAQ